MIAADLSEVRNPMRTLNNLMTKGQGSHYQVSDQVIAADTTRYRNPLDRINTKLTFSSLRRGSRLHSLLDVEEDEETVLHSGSRDVATSGDVEITESDGVDDIIGDNISVRSENERSDLNTKSELYQQGDVVNVTVLSVESDVEDVIKTGSLMALRLLQEIMMYCLKMKLLQRWRRLTEKMLVKLRKW